MKKFKIIYFYVMVIIFFTIMILGKLIYFQVFLSTETVERLKNTRYEVEDIYAKRGSILSSDGHKLAFDIEKYGIVLDPMNLGEQYISDMASILAKNLSKDEAEIENKIRDLREKKKHFYDLKVEINYEEKQNLIKDIQEYNKARKKSDRIRSKWIFYNQISERYNVKGNEFESIVGFLNKENNAVYGVERFYNDTLTGKEGKAKVYKAAVESVRAYTLESLIGDEVIEEAIPGNDVYLTIDSVMQYSMDEILKETFEKYEAEAVMGVLMEADTGKIIAMDSFPKANNKSDIKNRVITDLFEPGSIFKPVIASAAIEENLINKNSVIHSDGFIRVKDRVIHDHDNTTKGDLTLNKIIAHSGNVAMVKIGQLLDDKIYYKHLVDFGFSGKTGIDMDYEFSGKLFPEKSLTEVRKSNVSFGQGISMTQLQMLNALNATINGGNLLKPFLVEKIVDKDNNIVIQNEVTVLHKPLSERTSSQIREMLENVVKEGTGRAVAIEGYRIGGKTGTAQKAGPRGYEKGKYFSSFFAFLPADNPKYSILITVNEPKGAYYGAAVALPPAKQILEKLVKYKNMHPDVIIEETPKVEAKIIKKLEKDSIQNIEKDLKNSIMPNFVGLSLKEVLKINPKKYNINFKIIGRGIVTEQNIKKGTKISKDTVIMIKLN